MNIFNLRNLTKVLLLIVFNNLAAQEEAIETLTNSFVTISPGEFIMGSNKGRKNERPAHKVIISESYQLAKYEVTQKLWITVMQTTPADQLDILRKDLGKPNHQDLRGIGDNYPMYLVSWNEVQMFLIKLNLLSKKYIYRLPSEAEWEYAARAGTNTLYSFGNDENYYNEYGWYSKNSNDNTHPVGSKKPNSWGIHDMHGNVYEWVQDRDSDFSRKKQIDPKGPNYTDDTNTIFKHGHKGPDRIMKGGSWGNPAHSGHSARRTINNPNSRSRGLGFRLVRIPKI